VNRLVNLVLLVFLTLPITSLAADAPDFDQLDESVVRIITRKPDGIGTGTGFVINDQQNVVTNYHVIEGGRQYFVADGGVDEAHLKAAEVKWFSKEKDLAILHVPDLQRPALPLSSVEPSKGSQIHAIGFPGAADLLTEEVSIESSVTSGSISRVIDAAWQENTPLFRVVQHNSEINGGNSGGPLVNMCGQVVGVNTLKTSLALSIARGEVISGIFYASHISSLIEVLKAQQIPFTEVDAACSGSDSAAVAYIGIALIALGVAILAVVFSLSRPRQQLIHAIETYSQRLRRSMKPVKPTPPKPKQSTSQGWVLSGVDKQGESIRLTFDEAQLQDSTQGLTIGRSSRLSEFAIKDDSISRRHARLSYAENRVLVEDVNSLNGTKLDGVALEPFKPKPLSSGATLTVGEVKLSVAHAK
jgi:S1-C subfamily serine protease